MRNENCTCTHTSCEMWGDCKKCTEFHKGKPYCKSSSSRKAMLRVSFGLYDNVLSKMRKPGGNQQ